MNTTYRANNLRITATVTKPTRGDGLGPPQMLVHIPRRFRVNPGAILFSEAGEPLFILAAHHDYALQRVFMGFPINTQIELQMTEDVRSGISNTVLERRKSGPVRRIWACEDIITPDQVLGLDVPKQVFFVGSEVRWTDEINGKKVKDVLATNGIWRVEVS